jgi:hypothetical protein
MSVSQNSSRDDSAHTYRGRAFSGTEYQVRLLDLTYHNLFKV